MIVPPVAGIHALVAYSIYHAGDLHGGSASDAGEVSASRFVHGRWLTSAHPNYYFRQAALQPPELFQLQASRTRTGPIYKDGQNRSRF